MKRMNYLFFVFIGVLIAAAIIIIIDISIDTKVNTTESYIHENMLVKELEKYNKIKLENVEKVVVSKALEGGVLSTEVTDKEIISNIYEDLGNIKITEEANVAIEDNTTTYKFVLKENESVTFSFEGKIIVFNNSRYYTQGTISQNGIEF